MNKTGLGILDIGDGIMYSGGWVAAFDDRQMKEIALACIYSRDFQHGTDGHNAKIIIAKMTQLLIEVDKNLGKAWVAPKVE